MMAHNDRMYKNAFYPFPFNIKGLKGPQRAAKLCLSTVLLGHNKNFPPEAGSSGFIMKNDRLLYFLCYIDLKH